MGAAGAPSTPWSNAYNAGEHIRFIHSYIRNRREHEELPCEQEGACNRKPHIAMDCQVRNIDGRSSGDQQVESSSTCSLSSFWMPSGLCGACVVDETCADFASKLKPTTAIMMSSSAVSFPPAALPLGSMLVALPSYRVMTQSILSLSVPRMLTEHQATPGHQELVQPTHCCVEERDTPLLLHGDGLWLSAKVSSPLAGFAAVMGL